MTNEGLWIALSFASLLIASFRYIKKNLVAALDEKIKSVEESIVEVEIAKKSSEEKLAALRAEHEKALSQYEAVVTEAKAEAEKIIIDTEIKVKMFHDKTNDLLNDYKKNSEQAMIESFKGDVLMTLLQLFEKDQQENNKAEQGKNIDNSLNVIKKIWN
jgi:F0F1-type ATP synthase membrane subunit b/b'